jgi:hypothetical protein
MKGWILLSVVLSAFWLVGCGVVVLIELSQLPEGRSCTLRRASFEVFFESTKISAVRVRHPQLGVVVFPSTMSRPEIEAAVRRNVPRFYEPTNAPIEWDVPSNEPDNYYSIAFRSRRIFRIAIFPPLAIFLAVMVAGCGIRWVVQGFKA